ncbi:MAG: transferase [Muribaculaceae bacterium]|nr:transferase [Muribaculaceae bacterium]
MKFETIEREGEKVTIPIPQSFRDCYKLCQSDLYRLYGKLPTLTKVIALAIFTPRSQKSLLIWLRFAAARTKVWSKLFRGLYKWCSLKYNINIPSSTKIGYGFFIGHGICIIVNKDTVIGNNVNISQFLNIGTNHRTPALIADNVYLGPMCCVVEDVVIGHDSVIGAGAVVTKSVPSCSTAVGVPAKPINTHPQSYIDNPFPVKLMQQ